MAGQSVSGRGAGKLYPFVAIDRTSKFAFVQLVEKATRATASAFLAALIKAVSYRIHTVLTDNAIQFFFPPRYANGTTAGFITHMFDMRCREQGVFRRPILTPLMFCQTVRCGSAVGELKRVDRIARVRRAFSVQRWSVKKIGRESHVSRNTVRKIPRSDETDFSYERTHQPMARIGPWQEHLDRFLSANAGKPTRERLTLIRIFEELRALGYEGGYDAVRRFARNWSRSRGAAANEAYVPLFYEPGEAYQFDWSHEVVRFRA